MTLELKADGVTQQETVVTGTGMEIQDRRTEEQKKTHPILIVATDQFMSNWRSDFASGPSYAAWACQDGDEYRVERWVRSRKGMKRVRVVLDDGEKNKYRPRGPGHLSIYVVDGGHPARTW